MSLYLYLNNNFQCVYFLFLFKYFGMYSIGTHANSVHLYSILFLAFMNKLALHF